MYDLTECDLFIGGAQVPGQFFSWTAFKGKGGLTLLAMTASTLTVIPDLDTGRTVTVPLASFMFDMRQPSGVTLDGLNAHHAHHSFPQDRGYGYTSAGKWIAFGEWDAFRDVSEKEWKAAGLKKPRTRKAFDARAPSTPVPVKPAHGLALFDKFST